MGFFDRLLKSKQKVELPRPEVRADEPEIKIRSSSPKDPNRFSLDLDTFNDFEDFVSSKKEEVKVEGLIDTSEKIGQLLKESKSGNKDSMLKLAICYQTGKGVEQSYPEMLYWITKAIDAGNNFALFVMGLVYKNGWGTEINQENAVLYFRAAADKSESAAMLALADAYKDGVGIKQSYREAVKWYTAASNKNEFKAKQNLIMLYFDKKTSLISPNTCFKLLNELNEIHPDNRVSYLLAMCYIREIGTKNNLTRAVAYIQESRKYSVSEAYLEFAYVFEEGILGPKSATKSFTYMLKAAEYGNVLAMMLVATKYLNGFGTSKNPEKAVNWVFTAAKYEDPDALYIVGSFYEQGINVRRNQHTAIDYYIKSAELGCDDAKKKLRELGYRY